MHTNGHAQYSSGALVDGLHAASERTWSPQTDTQLFQVLKLYPSHPHHFEPYSGGAAKK